MITPEANRLRSIFDQAADLPPAERYRFVRDACAGDASLEAEIMTLLRSLDSQWASDMDSAVASLPHSSLDQYSKDISLPAVSIAGFQLRRVIGRGSMGVVCEAEQESPRRLVALKLLSTWNAGRELRRRFVAEADILARLKHPGIAQVIAAGTHDLGLSGHADALQQLLGSSPSVPWLAMELVENARTLTVYAQECSLGWRAKLELFALVCDAVHAGHLMGVIHRDLKPANVLITAQGQPKVIDYGVARALAVDMERTLHTTLSSGASFVGTLAYMSPEQVDGRAQQADVRSDVYSLGVMLYELITGQAPYTLDPASFAASARTITKEPPPRPRTYVPNCDPDLEAVILKSLEKEPVARYQSAADLGDDLRRVLDSRPIRARKPTPMYTVRKWIRRHPARAALAAITTAGVLIGAVGVSVGLARERAARTLADRQGRLANLRAADYALRIGDAATAKSCLSVIPVELRGWEWGFLRSQSDASTASRNLGDFAGHGGRMQLTPRNDLALALHDDRVDAVHVDRGQVLWSTPLSPSRSNVQYSRDGSVAIVPGIGESAVLDLSSGSVLCRCSHPKPSLAFGGAIDPLGRFAVVAGERFVAQFDIATGRSLRAWNVPGSVYAAAVDSSGRRIAWSDASEIVIVDSQTGTELSRTPTSRRTIWEPSFLRWSFDDQLLVCTADRDIEVFRTDGSRPPLRLSGSTQRISCIEFSPDGRYIVAGSQDSAIRVWDCGEGVCVCTLVGHDCAITMLMPRPLPDDGIVIESVDSSNTQRRWNVGSNRTPNSFSTQTGPGGGFVASIVWTPDQRSVICGTYGGDIEQHGLPPEKPGAYPPPEVPFVAVACARDASRSIAVTDRSVLVCDDLAPRRRRWSRSLLQPHAACTITDDGDFGAIGSLAGVVTIIDLREGKDVASLACHDGRIERLGFADSNDVIVVAGNDGSLDVWSIARGTRIRSLLPSTANSIANFTLSRDNRLIAYAVNGNSGEICLEHLADGSGRQTFPALGTFIWSLAFSPDAQRLAVGGQDRQTRILETATGQELLRLRDHQGSVMALTWSDDGRTLLSGGYDHKVFVYRAGNDAPKGPAAESSRIK